VGQDGATNVLVMAEIEEADEVRSDMGAESLSFKVNTL
jgi:hypothetical protein